ncbi:conserved hypothetical protein [Ricinus communis]|uniref:Transposase MuDR plant domain-containing protein n=1 Tax=Ricinus communis TaxID=3988 RepID=B9S9C5_RICCO|nr:conserved hypothetical protein [Ricinus communis]
MINTEVNIGIVCSEGIQHARNDQPCQDDGEIINDFEDSGEEEYDTSYSNEEGDLEINPNRKRKKHVVYNQKYDHNKLEFVPELVFYNATQPKEAMHRWGICGGYNLRWPRSSKKKWKLHVLVAANGGCML